MQLHGHKIRHVLMNACITSQFSYSPLAWMFQRRTLNIRVNKVHEKASRFVCKCESFLSFDDLLKRDKSVSIHKKIYKSLRQRPKRQKMI